MFVKGRETPRRVSKKVSQARYTGRDIFGLTPSGLLSYLLCDKWEINPQLSSTSDLYEQT